MKKTKISLILTISAGIIFLLTACSSAANPKETKSSKDSETFTEPSGAYTVLNKGTNGSAGISDNDKVTYVTFGLYPQSKKAKNVTVDEKKSKKSGAYTYYKGSDNAWYAKFKDNYYRVEPIKWRILDKNFDHDSLGDTPGVRLLLAENILINCAFYDQCEASLRKGNPNEPYLNNYENSRVRAFLNGIEYRNEDKNSSIFLDRGFLQSVFNAEENEMIVKTIVRNDETSANPYGGNTAAKFWNVGKNSYASTKTTEDKIFLPSEEELTKEEYQFPYDGSYGTGNSRIRMTTDYARDMGARQDDSEGSGGEYWLRSPYCRSETGVLIVGASGNSSMVANVNTWECGVVPALCIKN